MSTSSSSSSSFVRGNPSSTSSSSPPPAASSNSNNNSNSPVVSSIHKRGSSSVKQFPLGGNSVPSTSPSPVASSSSSSSSSPSTSSLRALFDSKKGSNSIITNTNTNSNANSNVNVSLSPSIGSSPTPPPPSSSSAPKTATVKSSSINIPMKSNPIKTSNPNAITPSTPSSSSTTTSPSPSPPPSSSSSSPSPPIGRRQSWGDIPSSSSSSIKTKSDSPAQSSPSTLILNANNQNKIIGIGMEKGKITLGEAKRSSGIKGNPSSPTSSSASSSPSLSPTLSPFSSPVDSSSSSPPRGRLSQTVKEIKKRNSEIISPSSMSVHKLQNNNFFEKSNATTTSNPTNATSGNGNIGPFRSSSNASASSLPLFPPPPSSTSSPLTSNVKPKISPSPSPSSSTVSTPSAIPSSSPQISETSKTNSANTLNSASSSPIPPNASASTASSTSSSATKFSHLSRNFKPSDPPSKFPILKGKSSISFPSASQSHFTDKDKEIKKSENDHESNYNSNKTMSMSIVVPEEEIYSATSSTSATDYHRPRLSVSRKSLACTLSEDEKKEIDDKCQIFITKCQIPTSSSSSRPFPTPADMESMKSLLVRSKVGRYLSPTVLTCQFHYDEISSENFISELNTLSFCMKNSIDNKDTKMLKTLISQAEIIENKMMAIPSFARKATMRVTKKNAAGGTPTASTPSASYPSPSPSPSSSTSLSPSSSPQLVMLNFFRLVDDAKTVLSSIDKEESDHIISLLQTGMKGKDRETLKIAIDKANSAAVGSIPPSLIQSASSLLIELDAKHLILFYLSTAIQQHDIQSIELSLNQAKQMNIGEDGREGKEIGEAKRILQEEKQKQMEKSQSDQNDNDNQQSQPNDSIDVSFDSEENNSRDGDGEAEGQIITVTSDVSSAVPHDNHYDDEFPEKNTDSISPQNLPPPPPPPSHSSASASSSGQRFPPPPPPQFQSNFTPKSNRNSNNNNNNNNNPQSNPSSTIPAVPSYVPQLPPPPLPSQTQLHARTSSNIATNQTITPSPSPPPHASTASATSTQPASRNIPQAQSNKGGNPSFSSSSSSATTATVSSSSSSASSSPSLFQHFVGLFSPKKKDKVKDKEKDKVIAKDSAPAPKFLLFGGPLTDALLHSDYDVPAFVHDAIEFLRSNGLNEAGLFRLAGNRDTMESLKKQLNTGKRLADIPFEVELHDIANIFKQYFRVLPEPLITYEAYPKFLLLGNVRGASAHKIIPKVKSLIESLPYAHQLVLSSLVHFLVEIADNSEVNKMTPENISICFAPNIFRPKEETPQSIMMEMPITISLFSVFIHFADQIFMKEEEAEGEGSKLSRFEF